MAGHEPEHTNAFFLQLARAARKTRDTDQGASFVSQVISNGGEAPPEPAPAATPDTAPLKLQQQEAKQFTAPPLDASPSNGGEDASFQRSSSHK